MTIEEARRAVLNVPEAFEYTADDYLDQLAEELLTARREMAAQAPTSLARALIYSGKTRAGLAEAIGVSVSAVGHWASGEKPLPASRLSEISLVLGVTPSDLRADPTPAPDTSRLSYFGWMVEHVVMRDYYGPDRPGIALKLGVTMAKLRAYTYGNEEIPERVVYVLARAYLPRMSEMLSPRTQIGPRPT